MQCGTVFLTPMIYVLNMPLSLVQRRPDRWSGGLHAPAWHRAPRPQIGELAHADAWGHDSYQAHRLRSLQALRAGTKHAAGGRIHILRCSRWVIHVLNVRDTDSYLFLECDLSSRISSVLAEGRAHPALHSSSQRCCLLYA